MKVSYITSIFLLLIVFFTALTPNSSFAHSGHKKDPVADVEVGGPSDSIYAVGNESPESDAGLSLPGERDLFGNPPSIPGLEMTDPLEHSKHSDKSHDSGHHEEPMVVHAKREWNSSDKSGYGFAWSLTLLTAGAFSFLVFKFPKL